MNPYISVLRKFVTNPLIIANMHMTVADIRKLAKEDPDIAGWVDELVQATNEALALLSKEGGSTDAKKAYSSSAVN